MAKPEKSSYWVANPAAELNSKESMSDAFSSTNIPCEMVMVPCGFLLRDPTATLELTTNLNVNSGEQPPRVQLLPLNSISEEVHDADSETETVRSSSPNFKFHWNTWEDYDNEKSRREIRQTLEWMKENGYGNFDKHTQDTWDELNAGAEAVTSEQPINSNCSISMQAESLLS